MEHNYRVSFKLGEASYEIESTDLKWLKNKEADYLRMISGKAVAKVPDEQTKDVKARSPVIPPQMTLNEFYRKYVLAIKSRPTISVYFVYYLQKIKKKDKIKTVDVTKCFQEIGYPNWNRINMTEALSSAKRRALVNYVNKLWSLTTTGEDYVFNAITGKKK